MSSKRTGRSDDYTGPTTAEAPPRSPSTCGGAPAPSRTDPSRPISVGRQGAYYVARHLFPPQAPRSVAVRHALLKHTVRSLWRVVDGTPLRGRLWLMGGMALGYARTGEALRNDLVDVDLGYADADHEALLAALPTLERHRFVPTYRLVSNAGVETALRLRRDGIWFDLIRCFERRRGDGDEREYWITYLTDRHSPAAPREVEVETEVGLQPKVPTVPPLYGTTWLRAEDLPRYLEEQYGDWAAPDEVFYGRSWDHVRDSPAVVRCDPWHGRWEPLA